VTSYSETVPGHPLEPTSVSVSSESAIVLYDPAEVDLSQPGRRHDSRIEPNAFGK